MSDKGLESLSGAFKNTSGLKHLSLDFTAYIWVWFTNNNNILNRCQEISGTGLTDLGNGLNGLTSLQVLYLKFQK